MNFIKVYDDNEFDFYITTKDFYYLEVCRFEGDYEGDYHWIVKASEEGVEPEDGLEISQKFYKEEEAYEFLHRLAEKLG